MAETDAPLWKTSFPVHQSAEHAVSRRQFCLTACCSVVAVGAGWFARDKLFPVPAGTAPKLVARVDQLPVGGYKLFAYPTAHHPCILVRLGESDFAAYSQACTHLQAPVHYLAVEKRFHCPCHEGSFSAEDGRVLAGPPRRALPRYPVELRDGEIWVVPAAT